MKAGLVSCSNGQQPDQEANIHCLEEILSEMGITAVAAEHLYAIDGVFGGTAKERAADLMAFYHRDDIDVIYDVSGGDIANEVLGYLDYDVIAGSQKQLWGYSDLTSVLNAVYAKTGRPSVLYQVKNLIRDDTGTLRDRFQNTVMNHKKELYQIQYEFLQGQTMEGMVAGGNIRCLLKLAGTPYWPDMKGKILLLESLGGSAAQISALFAQLEQMGVFEQVSGVLLGTFTALSQSENRKMPFELLSSHISSSLPVAQTPDIGHGLDAKAAVIGEFLRLAEIKTERLTLKPHGIQYLDTVYEYAKDPENTKYMLFLPDDSIEDTIRFLEDAACEWQKQEPSYYEFAIYNQQTREIAGSAGIYFNDTKDEAEFGWIVSKKYWNRGIASEAAQALLAYARKKHGIHQFTAHCDSQNAASFRVMEKLGMKREAVYGGRKNKISDEERKECLYKMFVP